MYIFLTIIIIVICLALGFIVLIQNPKGGGLNATFGGASNQMFGFQRTSSMVEKWTWGLVIALLVVSLVSSAFIDSADSLNTQEPINSFAPVTNPDDATSVPTAPIQPSLSPGDATIAPPPAEGGQTENP